MREKPTNTPIIHSVYSLCMVAPTCFGNVMPKHVGATIHNE
jgi:hypothetical protein